MFGYHVVPCQRGKTSPETVDGLKPPQLDDPPCPPAASPAASPPPRKTNPDPGTTNHETQLAINNTQNTKKKQKKKNTIHEIRIKINTITNTSTNTWPKKHKIQQHHNTTHKTTTLMKYTTHNTQYTIHEIHWQGPSPATAAGTAT